MRDGFCSLILRKHLTILSVVLKEIANMDKIELLKLINKGKSSFVEFKADTPDIKAETIGEYVVCFANSKGGKILLGVEDDSF